MLSILQGLFCGIIGFFRYFIFGIVRGCCVPYIIYNLYKYISNSNSINFIFKFLLYLILPILGLLFALFLILFFPVIGFYVSSLAGSISFLKMKQAWYNNINYCDKFLYYQFKIVKNENKNNIKFRLSFIKIIIALLSSVVNIIYSPFLSVCFICNLPKLIYNLNKNINNGIEKVFFILIFTIISILSIPFIIVLGILYSCIIGLFRGYMYGLVSSFSSIENDYNKLQNILCQR